jgi:hypothetical protein
MQTSSQMLRITEAEFNEFYPDLKSQYSFFNTPPPKDTTKQQFEQRYLRSKLWRLNNLYTVVNKKGELVTFRMNYAQHKVYAVSRQHSRVVILKSRQQGISTFWLVSYFDDTCVARNFSIGLMAQGTDEATTLLERVKLLWDKLSPDVKSYFKLKLTKDNTKEFGLSNTSSIFVRVSFRSATLQRLHISEFGKIANANPQRAKETKTGTLQALGEGNTGVVESTAEGRNDFKTMWDNSILALHSGQMTWKDFYPVFLSWLDDPDCNLSVPQTEDDEATKYFTELEKSTGRVITPNQRNFWIAQRRELAGDIYQEYPATPEEAFAISRDGTYYSRKFNEVVVRKGNVIPDLYDPNLDTDVYFDIGVDDYTVLIAVQWYRGKYRLVREYWNNGYDLEYYIDEIETWGWDIRELVFPWDIRVREATSGNNTGGRTRTREQIIKAYVKKSKLRNTTVRRIAKSGIADGIEAVRRMLPDMQIDPKLTYTIECLNNYSKEKDPKTQQWKTTPKHDEFSHGADTLRQIAVGHKERGESSMAIPSRHKPSKGYDV